MGHSLRLSSSSWANAAKLLRSTLTFTGDLGVESRLPLFAASLSALYGDWYRNEGRRSEDEDDCLEPEPGAFTYLRGNTPQQAAQESRDQCQ